MDYNVLFWFVPAASLLALAFAAYFYKQMKAQSEGTERMAYIAKAVRQGAMAYLKQQYKVVAIFFVIIAIAFGVMAYFGLQNNIVPVAFLTGGIFSGLAGFIGMKTATYASGRVAYACCDKEDGLNKGLQLAFRSGAVLGLTVVGLRIFLNDRGLAKIAIGLARGRKAYDKREYIKENDAKREMDKAMKIYK